MANLIDTIKNAWDAVIKNNPSTKIRGDVMNTELDRLADWVKTRVDATDGSRWLWLYIEDPGTLTELSSTDTSDKFPVWDESVGEWKFIDESNLPGGGATNITIVESPTAVEVQSSTGTNDSIALADATNAGAYLPAHYNRIARAVASTGTLTSGSTIACDTDTALIWQLTLDHSTATLAITNMLEGETVFIRCEQGSTGGDISTVTVNGNTAPIQGSFSSGAGEINLIAVTLFGSTNPVASVGL